MHRLTSTEYEKRVALSVSTPGFNSYCEDRGSEAGWNEQPRHGAAAYWASRSAASPRTHPQAEPRAPFLPDVGNDEDVAMKVHRRLGRAGRSGVESEQRHVVTPRDQGDRGERLVEGEAVKLGAVVGGAVEADNAFEKAAFLGAGDQFIEDAGVA